MLCYVMLCYANLCYVMLCYVMFLLCYVMLFDGMFMLCYVMLCYVMSPSTSSVARALALALSLSLPRQDWKVVAPFITGKALRPCLPLLLKHTPLCSRKMRLLILPAQSRANLALVLALAFANIALAFASSNLALAFASSNLAFASSRPPFGDCLIGKLELPSNGVFEGQTWKTDHGASRLCFVVVLYALLNHSVNTPCH